MTEEKREKESTIELIEDIVFYTIMTPLVLLVIILVWQRIVNPNRIPDIFGYKMFIVLDGNMDKDLQFGDLIFTKNVTDKDLEENDIIAYRSNKYTVTINRVHKKGVKIFFTSNSNDELPINSDSIEGIVVNRIAKIGLILYYAQNPYIIAFLICVVLIIGLILYYFAQERDKKNDVKLNES